MSKTDSYAYEIDLDDEGLTPVKLIRMVGENRRVLELGAASGHMSRVLKEKRGCAVVGVEIDPRWAELARPHCERVIVGDLDRLDFAETFGDDRFDVILCADVLEHLRDPWRVLGDACNYLKPDGRVVISVPNAAFHGILAEMCDARFGYRKLGLLDETHLRFFTRRELELLVLTAGLVPQEWDHVLKGAEHSEFVESWEKLPGDFRAMLRGIKDGEVYQLLVSARLPGKDEWDAYLRSWEGKVDGLLKDKVAISSERDARIADMERQLAERDRLLAARDGRVAELVRQLDEKGQLLHLKDQAIHGLKEASREKENQFEGQRVELERYIRRQTTNLSSRLTVEAELGKALEQTRATVAGLSNQLHVKNAEAGALSARIAELERQIHVFQTSRSWRITAPLRGLTQLLRGVDQPPAVSAVPIVVAAPEIPPAPVVEEKKLEACQDYRDYLACFRSCDDLTDEVRWAMRAQINAMPYQPTIAVRFSLLGLDNESFRRAFEAIRYQLYPRWELWVVDGEFATKSQLAEVHEAMKSDGRIRLPLAKVGGRGADVTSLAEIHGDCLYSLTPATIPPELTFYRLAFYLTRTNPDITAFVSGHIQAGGYAHWIRLFDDMQASCIKTLFAASAHFAHQPLISLVLPVYNPPEKWLRRAIDSVVDQHYSNWELCIADDCSSEPHVREVLERYASRDPRIKVVYRENNGHISAASNSALELAAGDFVAMLDHDDELTKDALLWVVDEINRHPDAALIYSDEDKLTPQGERRDPYFKPDWNPDLLMSQNYICHLAVYRTELLRSIGGFRVGFEGAQDYDLVLRYVEQIPAAQIYHIPRILYHWRAIPGSTAHVEEEVDAKPYAVEAAIKALNEHLKRIGVDAEASEDDEVRGSYRVRYALPEEPPLVSLIILTRNGLALVKQCVSSIVEKTLYPSYEIIIVDNGSDDPDTLAYLRELQQRGVARVLRDDSPFNFPALNNRAVQEAKGSIVGLLNNDIEVISPDWLGEMVSHALRPEIGAVGARLWYPDDTLQHGGVVMVGGVAGHAHKRLPRGHHGYARRAALIQDFSAVTAACLILRKEIYREVGGMDETLAVAFNDVDFCLRIRKAGYRNLWTPYAELYHHESATRGFEDTPEKKARFDTEIRFMRERWEELLDNDPAYNPNLAFDREDFSLAIPPRLLK